MKVRLGRVLTTITHNNQGQLKFEFSVPVEITDPDILSRMSNDEKFRTRDRPSLDEFRRLHREFIRTEESYISIYNISHP